MSSKTYHAPPDKRADILDGAPLQYAPGNELGVVFLFAHLAKKWRLKIENIKAGFPDCIAYQKTQKGERRIRIEFEYKSKSFKTHGHSAKDCDWIVCWEHNWPDAPKNLQIIELRLEFGLGFNVWIMPVKSLYKEELVDTTTGIWSVPSQAHKGDLVIFYFTLPEKALKYVYRLKERAAKMRAGYKPGMDYKASITRVCELKGMVFLEDLRRHKVLSTAGFVRTQRGRPNITEYWPYLYDIIIRRNPAVKPTLSKYAPESLV